MNEAFVTKNLFSKNISKRAEWDVNIPDNRPDVLKILYSKTTCFLSSTAVSDGELTAKIAVFADILYIPENGEENEICSLKTSENFEVKSDIPKDTSVELCNIKIQQRNENCVMLNSRKLGIRVECELLANGFSDVCLPDFSNESDVVFDQKELTASYIHTIKNDTLPFSEQFSLPPSKSGIQEILICNTALENCEVKAITNKAVFKGDISFKLLYFSENDTVEHIEFFAPFTEIIDATGLSDVLSIIFDANIGKAETSFDSNGKITVDGEISLNMTAFAKEKVRYCLDGYSPTFEETVSKDTLPYAFYSPYFCDTHNLKEVFSFEDFEISQILFAVPSSKVTSVEIRGNKAIITADFYCDVIYKAQNTIRCERKTKTIEFAQTTDENLCCNEANASCKVKNFSYAIQGNNCLEIKCNLDFKTYLYLKSQVTYINEIKTDKTKRKPLDRACVVAYYPKKDERLFDICKKYNSSPDKVRSLNSLESSDICKKGSCIIIE